MLTRWWRWYRESPVRYLVGAAVLTFIVLSGSYGEGHPHNRADIVQFRGLPIPHPAPWALALVAVGAAAVAVSYKWPYAVLALSTGTVTVYTLLNYVNGAALVAPAVAVYVLATCVRPVRAIAAAAVAVAVLFAATAARNPFHTPFGGTTVVLPVLFAAACLAGIAVTNRRAYVVSIQARAEDVAQRRVDEERLRIARELHDIVAHTMATINVQAGAAAHVLGENPAAASDALQAIRQSSRDGLRELRAILNVLRQPDLESGDGEPTMPTPGLDQLAGLINGACNAGLPTTMTQSGEARPLSPAVDLAGYRIVQESLTNSIKHAGPATARVDLHYDEDSLRIEITDTGLGAPAHPVPIVDGHGIIGMRERASSVGGSLEAGPSAQGGYRVAAILPATSGAPA